jgi:hypothetical protein
MPSPSRLLWLDDRLCPHDLQPGRPNHLLLNADCHGRDSLIAMDSRAAICIRALILQTMRGARSCARRSRLLGAFEKNGGRAMPAGSTREKLGLHDESKENLLKKY